MTNEIILDKVKDAIASSCGIDRETITPDLTLFDNLGITSIDIVDILYTLETDFDITLKVSEIESDARGEIGDTSFEVDNVITTEGLNALKKRLPEIPTEKLIPGLTIYEIINLITVQSLCNMIAYKLPSNGKNEDTKE